MLDRHKGRLGLMRAGIDSTALPRAMTLASCRRAVARFGELAVGADAVLRVQAPEQSFIRPRHRGIVVSQDELCFPAQSRTEVRMAGVEAIELAFHAAPPAFRIARLSATFASWTLYAFWLSGVAFFSAASAAAFALSSFSGLPVNSCSASGEIQGTGAT